MSRWQVVFQKQAQLAGAHRHLHHPAAMHHGDRRQGLGFGRRVCCRGEAEDRYLAMCGTNGLNRRSRIQTMRS